MMIFTQLLKKTVYSFAERIPNVSQEYGEFFTHYYSIAFAAMVESWLFGDIKQTPEELIAFIDISINDHIRGALLRNEKDT